MKHLLLICQKHPGRPLLLMGVWLNSSNQLGLLREAEERDEDRYMRGPSFLFVRVTDELILIDVALVKPRWR